MRKYLRWSTSPMVKVWKDNGCILHFPTRQNHQNSCQHHIATQTLKITSFPILHMLPFVFVCLQAQVREHRCVSFLVIQNRKIGNGHMTQYGFEFLSLYSLFNHRTSSTVFFLLLMPPLVFKKKSPQKKMSSCLVNEIPLEK